MPIIGNLREDSNICNYWIHRARAELIRDWVNTIITKIEYHLSCSSSYRDKPHELGALPYVLESIPFLKFFVKKIEFHLALILITSRDQKNLAHLIILTKWSRTRLVHLYLLLDHPNNNIYSSTVFPIHYINSHLISSQFFFSFNFTYVTLYSSLSQ